MKVKTGGRVRSNPQFFTTKDGEEWIAVGSDDHNLYIINLNKPHNPFKIEVGGSIVSSPLYYTTNDREEWITVGSDDNLYMMKLYLDPIQSEVRP